MLDLSPLVPTPAVFPVLVGPLQTLLALLPAILLGVGSMLFAVFKPGGFVRLMRFCWRQKLFLGSVAAIVVAWQYGWPGRLLSGNGPVVRADGFNARTDWDSVRGGSLRLGRGPGEVDPTAPGVVWTNERDKTVLSSPAVTGDRVLFSTATGIGPFSPEGRGAVVCVDAHSGREIWRYAPENYRATFSSPVVSGNSVVCGEGLHQVGDARVTCLDLESGQRRWEFRTQSHVEATAAIANGRVFIGAGGDGFYCLTLDPDPSGEPQVLWHLEAGDFPDCESSPVVSGGVVYFGLGDGGNAVCAVQAETGSLLWKVATPYPVFAPPTVAGDKLFIATGNGNYVQSAADLLAMKLQVLQDDGATDEQLAAARERWKPVGEVWCIDIATQTVDWKFTTGDAILGAIVREEDAVCFGSRDGHLYRVSPAGGLLAKRDLHEPLLSSPALGSKHIYGTTASGRLFCLDKTSLQPVWDSSLGRGETFSSSPVIAHGHVYIGTAEQGLCCVGRPGEPPPPVWTHGDVGGSADDVRVPDLPEVLWQFPGHDDPLFMVTAPLMPLNGAVYAAGIRSGRTELVKLNVAAVEPSQRVAWSRSFGTEALDVAPVGCGDRLCVIARDDRSSVMTLHCLSADDGRPIWGLTIAAPNALSQSHALSRGVAVTPRRAGMSLDARRIYVWTGDDQLGCFDLATGATQWDQSMPGQSTPGSDPAVNRTGPGGIGVGVPVVENDLLFAITGPARGSGGVSDSRAVLTALDAVTGIPLWTVRLDGEPIGSPIVDGQQVRVPRAEEVAVHRIVDGAFLRTEPVDEKSLAVELAADEYGEAIMPAVSLKGRVYVATDRGRIVCLGAGQP
jgi:outer membrane protein assembly factor BamB